jgi:hypothetical protein
MVTRKTLLERGYGGRGGRREVEIPIGVGGWEAFRSYEQLNHAIELAERALQEVRLTENAQRSLINAEHTMQSIAAGWVGGYRMDHTIEDFERRLRKLETRH